MRNDRIVVVVVNGRSRRDAGDVNWPCYLRSRSVSPRLFHFFGFLPLGNMGMFPGAPVFKQSGYQNELIPRSVSPVTLAKLIQRHYAHGMGI